MHRTLELVIFDDCEDLEMVSLASEAARKRGWHPEIFNDAERASSATGLFTRGVITSVIKNYQVSSNILTPLDVSRLLEIPRVVIVEDYMKPQDYIRPNFNDITVSREDGLRVLPVIGRWLESLPPAC